MDAASRFEAAKQLFGKLIGGLEHVSWDQLPESVKNYITDNPKATALQLIFVVVALVPGLVVAPALAALGFGSIGPIAGSAAAGYQGANGATAAFAFLQGAGMGGAAATVVNGVVTGVSAAVGVAAEWFKWRGAGA